MGRPLDGLVTPHLALQFLSRDPGIPQALDLVIPQRSGGICFCFVVALALVLAFAFFACHSEAQRRNLLLSLEAEHLK
jgi:hypothetical protein